MNEHWTINSVRYDIRNRECAWDIVEVWDGEPHHAVTTVRSSRADAEAICAAHNREE